MLGVVGGRDQDHVGAAVGGRRGEGKAHLAAGVIDEAHWIDGLARAARGDHHLATREVVTRADGVNHRVEDRRRDSEAAGARVAAREVACVRLDDIDLAVAQRGDVLLHRRLGPHGVIHRGCDHHRAPRGQQRRGDDIVRAAACDPSDHIGRCRRDQDQLGPVAEEHVRLGAADGGPHAGQDRSAGDALERRRPDKARRRRRHRDTHLAPGLRQRRSQVDDLVRRDASGDQQRDAQAAQLVGDRRRV